MPLWSDDFDRDDGPIGPNWVVDSGSPSVSGNAFHSGGAFAARAGATTGPGAAMAEVTVDWTTTADAALMPCVKWSTTGPMWVAARGRIVAGDLVVDIYARNYSTYGAMGSAATISPAPSSCTIRLTHQSNVYTLYVDGVQKCQTTSSVYAAGQYVGLVGTSGPGDGDDFSCSGDGQRQLQVSPRVIGTDDGDTLISMLATAVTWTVGTPGSPAFTVSDGAISGQTITSTQTAQAIFSPPASPTTVTLADVSDGITASITVVEGVYLGSGTGGIGGLTEAAIDWLEAQAAHGGLVLADNDTTEGDVGGIELKGAFGSLLLGVRSGTTPSGSNQAIADIILTLWDILNGGVEHTSESDVFQTSLDTKALATTLRDLWLTGNDSTLWTVNDVLDMLSGSPRANHQDILTAISGIVVDNTEVIDAIEAAQGDPLATIKAVLDSIFTLGGSESNYTLATVKTWVEAARGTNLPTIRDVLNKLGTSGNTIEARIDALSDLIVSETTIQGMLDILLTAISGGVGVTLTSVLDDVIEAINAIPPATGGSANLWPGAGSVEIADPVALSDGLVVTGPLNGLLFTITGTPSGAGKYVFGDVDSWQHTGGVIFCTDNGYYERAESFGLETQIVIPRTMEQAASAVIRLNAGWSGTVRAWTRSV